MERNGHHSAHSSQEVKAINPIEAYSAFYKHNGDLDSIMSNYPGRSRDEIQRALDAALEQPHHVLWVNLTPEELSTSKGEGKQS